MESALRFPAKENPNMKNALFDWPMVLQHDVKTKYRLISRELSGMAIHGGGFTFLPRGFTRLPYAQNIVKVLFRDKQNVLLKLQKKVDRSEAYTLIQPHPSFANTEFGVLINSFLGYTKPLNAFMKEYIFLGIIPASAARHRSVQGFRSNGHTVQFTNCDANPNSYFAFMPNHNLQTPSSYGASWHIFETSRVAEDWRSKAISITHPDGTMPNEFFFLTELHFGGCWNLHLQ